MKRDLSIFRPYALGAVLLGLSGCDLNSGEISGPNICTTSDSQDYISKRVIPDLERSEFVDCEGLHNGNHVDTCKGRDGIPMMFKTLEGDLNEFRLDGKFVSLSVDDIELREQTFDDAHEPLTYLNYELTVNGETVTTRDQKKVNVGGLEVKFLFSRHDFETERTNENCGRYSTNVEVRMPTSHDLSKLEIKGGKIEHLPFIVESENDSKYRICDDCGYDVGTVIMKAEDKTVLRTSGMTYNLYVDDVNAYPNYKDRDVEAEINGNWFRIDEYSYGVVNGTIVAVMELYEGNGTVDSGYVKFAIAEEDK